MTTPFIGIQIGPQTMYDEGIDNSLNLLQEHASVNALIVTTHAYYGAHDRPAETLASDHGIPSRDERTRNLSKVWINHNDRHFAGTFLRHKRDPAEEYYGRDILADLEEPARKRGMKLIARIHEPHQLRSIKYIDNWVKIMSLDVFGRVYGNTCFNNPDYNNFWVSTMDDMFKSYPQLDGVQYGSERSGPLSRVLLHGEVPGCFCEYCCARARRKGIDPERAIAGYKLLYEYIAGLKAGRLNPVDGVLATLLRVLLKYPEVFAWEYEAHAAKEEQLKRLYGVVKAVRPSALFGIHIDHQQSTYDLFQRAELEYAEMAEYCDFIKPIVYHDIAAPRVRRWLLDSVHASFLSELSLEHLLEGFYDTMGLDKTVEPKLDEMDHTGFTEDYVYRLTKRLVTSAGGKAAVYPGLGFDLPWQDKPLPGDPDVVYKTVHKAFEAGADGIVLSRDYAEMRLHNIKAVGRALKEIL